MLHVLLIKPESISTANPILLNLQSSQVFHIQNTVIMFEFRSRNSRLLFQPDPHKTETSQCTIAAQLSHMHVCVCAYGWESTVHESWCRSGPFKAVRERRGGGELKELAERKKRKTSLCINTLNISSQFHSLSLCLLYTCSLHFMISPRSPSPSVSDCGFSFQQQHYPPRVLKPVNQPRNPSIHSFC